MYIHPDTPYTPYVHPIHPTSTPYIIIIIIGVMYIHLDYQVNLLGGLYAN